MRHMTKPGFVYPNTILILPSWCKVKWYFLDASSFWPTSIWNSTNLKYLYQHAFKIIDSVVKKNQIWYAENENTDEIMRISWSSKSCIKNTQIWLLGGGVEEWEKRCKPLGTRQVGLQKISCKNSNRNRLKNDVV